MTLRGIHARAVARLVNVGVSVIELVQPEAPETWVITFNNPAASEASRADLAPFQGMRFLEAFPAVAGTPLIDWYREVLRTGEEKELPELVYGDANVPEAAFRVWLSPLVGRSVLGQYVNVTEQRRAEGELRRVNAALEARVERRTRELRRAEQKIADVAYAAAHDLQTPLQQVLLLSELASEGANDDVKKHLDAMASEVVRMRRKVSALLDYTADTPLEPSAFDAARAVASAIDRTVAASGRDRVVVEGEGVMATTDPIRFDIVVTELISNALLHGDHEGAGVRVVLTRQPDGITVDVEDQGPGIAREHHAEVFRVFRRLPGPMAGEREGVGLALCRGAVDACGGSIVVDSEPGRGAKFTATFPDLQPGTSLNPPPA